MPERDPFPIVVSRSVGAITRAYGRAAPVGAASLRLHAALLRLAPAAPFAPNEHARLSRLSSRAAKVAVGAGGRRGWVRIEADPDRPRRKTVRFTSAGIDAGAVAADALQAAERGWLDDTGDGDQLRRIAESLVGALELELPHQPISYGTADVTITGGAYSRAADPDPRVPPHGADWRPVLRTDASSAAGLPMSALLSQVLVQFTIDYERRGGVNLDAAIKVLRHIGDHGVPLDALAEQGITGHGKSYLERHGVVQVGRSPKGDERLVRLTPSGVRLRDAFIPLVAQIEADWPERYGESTIEELTAELTARRGSWLPTDERGATAEDHAVVQLLSSD